MTVRQTVREILDRFGQAIDPKPDAEALRVDAIKPTLRDRDSLVNVLTDLTPAKLVSIFNDADNGNIGPQIELAQTIEERDGHVRSLLETRTLAVTGLEWIISPGDETPAAQDAADEFRAAWDRLSSRNLMELLLAALIQQWAIVQVRWETQGKTWLPVYAEEVDARKLCYPWTEGTASQPVGIPRIQIGWTMADSLAITPGNFVTHSFRDHRGRPGRGAPVRSIAFWWMCKRFAAIDLAQLLEQFGRPWRAVKYDPAATSAQIAAVLDTLRKASADLAIAIPKSAELQLIEGLKGGDVPHENWIKCCNDEMAKAVIGSTTIAEAAQNSESVSSPTHADVRILRRDADAQALAETIRRDLIVPFTLWKYGANVPAPRLSPNLARKPDPATRAGVYVQAAQLGLSVKTDQLYQDLALEKPEDVPEVVRLGPGGIQENRGDAETQREGVEREDRRQETEVGQVTEGTPAPAGGPTGAAAPFTLNGAQIEAARTVMADLVNGLMPEAAATQLLIAVGIPEDRVRQMVEAVRGFVPRPTPEQAAASGGDNRQDAELQSGDEKTETEGEGDHETTKA